MVSEFIQTKSSQKEIKQKNSKREISTRSPIAQCENESAAVQKIRWEHVITLNDFDGMH